MKHSQSERPATHEQVVRFDADLLVLNQYSIGDPHPDYTYEKALAAMRRALDFALAAEVAFGIRGVDSIIYKFGRLFPAERQKLEAYVEEKRKALLDQLDQSIR